MILEWETSGHKHSHWLQPGATATIGRGADCTITLAHATVSRRHAEVFPAGQGFYVRNLSRTTPVFIELHGGVTRLDAGQHGPLQTGALLRLGEVQVAVRAPVTLRVRCPGPCGRVVEVPASGFCPYCGTALATADTFTG